MKKLLFTFALTIVYFTGVAQTSPLCVNAAQICPAGNMSFPASVDQTAETGPNYDCLGSQPNPSWFYFQIDTPGDLVINMIQVDSTDTGVDIDFICWGPFSSPTTPCTDSISLQSSAVDCSYSTDFMEVLDVY
ncbi:MAG: hypothetical protein JNL24_12770 [Bacteroidia bacterium]|nr:hypothetical protein [Bacteroidia bacterium]